MVRKVDQMIRKIIQLVVIVISILLCVLSVSNNRDATIIAVAFISTILGCVSFILNTTVARFLHILSLFILYEISISAQSPIMEAYLPLVILIISVSVLLPVKVALDDSVVLKLPSMYRIINTNELNRITKKQVIVEMNITNVMRIIYMNCSMVIIMCIILIILLFLQHSFITTIYVIISLTLLFSRLRNTLFFQCVGSVCLVDDEHVNINGSIGEVNFQLKNRCSEKISKSTYAIIYDNKYIGFLDCETY